MTPPPYVLPGPSGRWDVRWELTNEYAHNEYGEHTDLWLRSEIWNLQRKQTVSPPSRRPIGQSVMGFAKALASILL